MSILHDKDIIGAVDDILRQVEKPRKSTMKKLEGDKARIENKKGSYVLRGRMLKDWQAGFYEPGWDPVDYLRDSINRYGWENFPIWGIKGSKKSNRALFYLHKIYGNWDLAHKHMPIKPLEFTDLLKQKGRIPCIIWDDIAGWFDSQLYFENRELYTKIKRCWALMRTKLNVFGATLPNKQELPGFMLKDITAEMFCSPRCTLTYDRWSWRKDYKDPTKVKYRPINVMENEPFDMYSVPTKQFKRYFERRIELADIGTRDMIGILEEAFDDAPNEEELIDEAKSAASKAASQLAHSRWNPDKVNKKYKKKKENEKAE